MFSRFFKSKKSATPLFDLCSQVSLLTVLQTVENFDPTSEWKRAVVLSHLMMMGAAEHIRDLKWDQGAAWDNSQKFFHDTNMDVITAEALVWIGWCCLTYGRLSVITRWVTELVF